MGVRLISGVAIGVSLLGTLLCLVGVPMILNEIQTIRTDLADEMSLFKVFVSLPDVGVDV